MRPASVDVHASGVVVHGSIDLPTPQPLLQALASLRSPLR